MDERYYQVVEQDSLAQKLAVAARRRIYQTFLKFCQPQPNSRILDIGVSDTPHDIANIFERSYPHLENVTAVGLGEGMHFRRDYPPIAYHQVAPDQRLPFTDKAFDIVLSNAVLEHTGSVEKQRHFVAEHLRLGRQIFITVPNRYFPVEHHTAIPLMHYSNTTFTFACRLLGKSEWIDSERLILMTKDRLRALVPPGADYRIGTTGFNLGTFSSNLYLYMKG